MNTLTRWHTDPDYAENVTLAFFGGLLIGCLAFVWLSVWGIV